MMYCKDCIADKSLCPQCNQSQDPRPFLFIQRTPRCPFGFLDCIYEPKEHEPDCNIGCENGDNYDWEDK